MDGQQQSFKYYDNTLMISFSNSKNNNRKRYSRMRSYVFLFFILVILIPSTGLAVTTMKVLYSGNVNGETKPCG